MSLDALADLSNVGSLAAFAIVCVTVIYLRFTIPAWRGRSARRSIPIIPILGAVMCLVLLMSLMAATATRNFFLIYLGVGILVYFAYGMWNSKLGKGIAVEGHEAKPMELPGEEEA